MESSEQYYSRTWEEASLAYKERGFYEWCVKQISTGTHILEIGSGIGIATLSLIEAGYVVSSLEENVYNFKKTEITLENGGNKTNSILFIDEAINFFGENNLIRSNFITDYGQIVDTVKYDTIVCWCIGVHPLAHMNPDLQKLGYSERDFYHYRYLIYNRIFQIMSLRLPVGGVISLIERFGLLTESQISEEMAWFSKEYELEKYGLKLEKIDQLPIGDFTSIPGIEMLPIKEGKIVSNLEKTQACLLSYTITRVKETNQSETKE